MADRVEGEEGGSREKKLECNWNCCRTRARPSATVMSKGYFCTALGTYKREY